MTLTDSYAVGPSVPPVRELTLGRLLFEAAVLQPDRVALIAGVAEPENRRSWTYSQLLDEATVAAKALRTRFEPGERVAVWAPNHPEWVVLEFAVAMAGLILVTVNPGFRASEVQYVLNQSRSAGVITATEFRGNPMLSIVHEIQPECPELREVIRLDQWPEFLASAAAFDGELTDPDPSDPVMIQYTSGTTGFPKGALLHHRGLVNNGSHIADRQGLCDGAVSIAVMPFPHRWLCLHRDRRGLQAGDVGAGRVLRSCPRPRTVRYLQGNGDARRTHDAGRDDDPWSEMLVTAAGGFESRPIRSKTESCLRGRQFHGRRRPTAETSAASPFADSGEPVEVRRRSAAPMSRLERITSDPVICHGKPCVRGLRYPVEVLLELLASGMTVEAIRDDFPDLEREDILAVLEYAGIATRVGTIVPITAA